MYHKPEDIAEQYELSVSQITKGRDSYICQTDRGVKLLEPFGGSAERAEFLLEWEEAVNETGYRTEQILRTKEGTALAEDEFGKHYLMKDYFGGSECSTRKWEDMEQAAAALARFHKAGSGCALVPPSFMQQEPDALLLLYEKHTRELVKVKNYVRSRRSKNEFEECFAKHYDAFYQKALRAQKLLGGQTKSSAPLFVHGDYNQHNVLRTPEGWQVIHLEHLKKAPAMYDLSNFLRKMLEKNGWKAELGDRLIRAYDGIRSVSEDDMRLLFVMLSYPEKFWKVANHYSSSHKAWLSKRDLEKLEHVIAQEEQKEELLKFLFPFS